MNRLPRYDYTPRESSNRETGCIGHRLDGWPNRDFNVGAIVALAPNLQPFADLLGTDQSTVRTVLNSWGPGKFDAELILDGKAFNPTQITDGIVTGTNVPGATLLPPAFGLGGVKVACILCQNCVTCPRETLVKSITYEDAPTRISVAEVIDSELRWWDLLCVSTRGWSGFPSVLDRPLRHLSV